MQSVNIPESFSAPELRQLALHWLAVRGVREKIAGVRQLATDWRAGRVGLDAVMTLVPGDRGIPGQPEQPVCVPPRDVPRRAMNTPEGRAAMIHAMAHIEFNAINLALDAIWRFPDLPHEYYADWLRVANEEALHFDLLAAHLNTLGSSYGDFPAHNGLWEWADKTRHDVLARMALLPRTMEARGLDVTPGMKARLVQAGDEAVAPIMDVILRDEIGHVAIGNRWFKFLCAQRGLAPHPTYQALLVEYHVPVFRGPFNLEARRAAGFGATELREWSGGE